MRTIRVYVDASLSAGEERDLDERAAHHVVRVLRRRVGDRIVLFDGRGHEAPAEIVAAHRRQGCRVRIDSVARVDRESPLAIELVQAMARGDKLDLVVQKATELGAAAIRPVLTRRSEVRPAEASRRLERWREIAVNACEQCGRTVLPEIHPPAPLAEVDCRAGLRLAPVPGGERRLADLGPIESSVAVAIGPEGGLDEQDLAVLTARGFEPVTLGPRILRTETAAIAVTAALQCLYGDLN